MKNSTRKNQKLLYIEENCPSSKDTAHIVGENLQQLRIYKRDDAWNTQRT